MRIPDILLATVAVCVIGIYGPPVLRDDVDPIKTGSTKGSFVVLPVERTSRRIIEDVDLQKTFRMHTIDAQKSDRMAQMTTPAGGTPNDSTQGDALAQTDTVPAVDESALRYFAKKGDTARLNAEISRLKALYPDWVPPADPLAVTENADVQLEAMWELYSRSRYDEVRKAISDRQAKEPAWQPPQDLIDRLSVAEARAALVAASDTKNYNDVVRIGTEAPSLLTCSEVDILWRLAEAFALTDRTPRASDVYRYALANCQDPAERTATVQKAAALLPPEAVVELISLETTGPEGKSEFEPLKDDLARRFVSDAGDKPGIVVPVAYLERLEGLATASNLPADSLLLGWYYYRRGQADKAEPWFRRAHTTQASAVSAQGLALVLDARKDYASAEDILFPFQASTTETTALYLASVADLLALDPPIAIASDVLQRMSETTVRNRNAAAAQQFGWYARAFDQTETAAQWFSAALRWKPGDEPSAYGLGLSLYDLGGGDAFAQVQATWAGLSKRIAAIGLPQDSASQRQSARRRLSEETAIDDAAETDVDNSNVRAVRRTTERARPQNTISATVTKTATTGCATAINPARLSPAQALTRGWCLMEINRPMEAVGAFEVALSVGTGKTREDAAYGQSLAYLRVGLSDKAAVSTTKSTLSPGRAVELQTNILSTRAIEAFRIGRYREAIIALDQRAQIAAERSDLMVLRGYAYLKLDAYADARRIFEAVAATGDRGGVRGLADVRAAMQATGG